MSLAGRLVHGLDSLVGLEGVDGTLVGAPLDEQRTNHGEIRSKGVLHTDLVAQQAMRMIVVSWSPLSRKAGRSRIQSPDSVRLLTALISCLISPAAIVGF